MRGKEHCDEIVRLIDDVFRELDIGPQEKSRVWRRSCGYPSCVFRTGPEPMTSIMPTPHHHVGVCMSMAKPAPSSASAHGSHPCWRCVRRLFPCKRCRDDD
jgi:hypothetical protein